MIICHSRKYIFIHIHKCGGTSIERALAATLNEDDLLLGSTAAGTATALRYRGTLIHPHAPADDIRAFTGAEIYARYYKFAVVRHPFDLFVSLYSHTLDRLRRLANLAGMDLASYADHLKHAAPASPGDLLTISAAAAYAAGTGLSGFVHAPLILSWRWFEPQWMRITASMQDGGARMAPEQIGRQETLDTDFARFLEAVGLDRVSLPIANKSISRIGCTLSDADRALIRIRMAPDFDILGYQG